MTNIHNERGDYRYGTIGEINDNVKDFLHASGTVGSVDGSERDFVTLREQCTGDWQANLYISICCWAQSICPDKKCTVTCQAKRTHVWTIAADDDK